MSFGFDSWLFNDDNGVGVVGLDSGRSGYDHRTGIHNSVHRLGENFQILKERNLGIAQYVVSEMPHPDHRDSMVAVIDSFTNQRLTYGQLHWSIRALASSLYHGLGMRKGDVIFVLSPNSILYPVMCLAIFSIGAILSPANPINTEAEIAKQVRDSGAKFIISAPEELHKVVKKNGVPVLTTMRTSDENLLSINELMEGGDPVEFPLVNISPSDTAAVLYSSGTTGTTKGVILTHSQLLATVVLLKWAIYATSSQNDVFLCFIPMFHIYGLVFFGLGLFTAGITTVLMPRFDLQAMLDAIESHKVNNLPAVPPVILGLVKCATKLKCDLSSLKRVGSGAAPLSREVSNAFRERFPWIELRQGYGLTESCAAATFFVHDKEAKAHPGSCGRLLPTFSAKIVDIETGLPLPPCKEGEIWMKSPVIMKGYLCNEEATAATLDPDGWLKTGDLGYFDEDGFLYIVDRIKELIKHNGYQVAPAELEAVLLSHPQILDAAVIPLEDEETGQIPMAYVVRAAGSDLTEENIIQFVANQVAPYKKVRRVGFLSMIPKSVAGKILRRQLVAHSQQQAISKL